MMQTSQFITLLTVLLVIGALYAINAEKPQPKIVEGYKMSAGGIVGIVIFVLIVIASIFACTKGFCIWTYMWDFFAAIGSAIFGN